MIIYILAAIGIVGLIFGFWSIFYLRKFARTEYATPFWKKLRIGVLVFAILIALLTWPGTYFMGYPFKGENETVRIVGIPFFVAYFDSEGRDYVGPLTLPGVIMNGLFWFVCPHLLLAAYSKRLEKYQKA